MTLHVRASYRRLGVACPHVLQTMMAQMSGTLETCGRALEICVPNWIARPIKPFFIYLRPMTHWEPRDTWQHWAFPGREVESEAIGHVVVSKPTSVGSVRSGATWHVVAPELTSIGR
jgi:hypothetical protein